LVKVTFWRLWLGPLRLPKQRPDGMFPTKGRARERSEGHAR
jgi:hypothetical protein